MVAIVHTVGSGIRGTESKRSKHGVRLFCPIVDLTEWTAIDSLVLLSISGDIDCELIVYSADSRMVPF